jgi:hypothetical protein
MEVSSGFQCPGESNFISHYFGSQSSSGMYFPYYSQLLATATAFPKSRKKINNLLHERKVYLSDLIKAFKRFPDVLYFILDAVSNVILYTYGSVYANLANRLNLRVEKLTIPIPVSALPGADVF